MYQKNIVMKNLIFSTVLLASFSLISCEKKTTTTVNEDGGTTTVEKVGLDKEQIDSTAQNVKEGVQNAAEKTGEALEDAGEKLKIGASKTEHDIREATDGDGNPKK